MKKQLAIMIMVFATIGVYAQHDHSEHASQPQEKSSASFEDGKLNAAYGHYLHLKDALVLSNASEAKKAAIELQKSLASIPNGAKAAIEAEKVSVTTDLNEQRNSFSTLSNEMTALIKVSKLSAGSIYVEYCPMANQNQGAFWLSNEKEIKNPYFGDMMLRCGSVKETIQ
jgi:hypothetical protein